jgi:hypothetical protein
MTNDVTLVYHIERDAEGYVSVVAVVEDMRLVRNQTLLDPPEYGPAVCEAGFYLNEDEQLPEDDDELLTFLSEFDLDWKIYEDFFD